MWCDMMRDNRNKEDDMSLYVHIPFCERKCFYCSFVIAVGQTHRMDEYLTSIEQEMARYKGKTIRTIYIGGGTPSFLSTEQIDYLFSAIRRNFFIHPDTEITMEANPKDLDRDKLKQIREHGINRISVGVQTMNDARLSYLGRNHNSDDVVSTVHLVQEYIPNLSLDLMYGFPQQTIEDIKQDIHAITRFNSEHLSLYTLTIEPNSRFFTQHVKLDDEQLADQYCFVIDQLHKKGYEQYEVSNFAKKGFASKHNLNYWQGGDYIGIGVGAHSYVGGRRFWNVDKFSDYLKRMRDEGMAEAGDKILSTYDQFMDAFLFGLRMNAGIDLERLQRRFDCVLDEQRQNTLKQLEEAHFLRRDQQKIKVTDEGRIVLDELCSRLV
jgi:putative oxygen-independent coproporphyrinogen III oxidase